MHSSLVAKSSSHKCLVVLGWRSGEREEKWDSGREGRDCMFNNSHNICMRLEEGVGEGGRWE